MPPKKRKSTAVTDEQAPYSINGYIKKLRSQKEDPPITLPDEEGEKCTIKRPCSQRFSLPDSIIYYIAQNPKSVYGQQNLIKSCKLLYRMSRIIPVRKVQCDRDNTITMWSSFARRGWKKLKHGEESMFKFWLHNELFIRWSLNVNAASTLPQHINHFTLTKLTLYKQELTFGELELFTGGGELRSIEFCKNVVKDANGSITDFEKVFEVLMCKHMEIILPPGLHGFDKETATNMVQILESERTPCTIDVHNIPESFHFQSFTDFLKINMANRMHTIDLRFAATISLPYKTQLQQSVNEIIQIRNTRGRGVPLIYFTGQNDQAYWQLWTMRHRYW